MFNFMKRKEKKKTIETPVVELKINKVQSMHHHRSRIKNLRDEFEIKSIRLEQLELDDITPRSHRVKEIDLTIQRMAFIKYEIDIREGLLKWL